MGRVILKAGFVFLFMALLAVQALTGFMRDLFANGVYPRAMRAFDWIIGTFFVGSFGTIGGAVVLIGIGTIFAALIVRQGVKGAAA